MNRRRLIRLVGAGGALALAGCSGETPTQDDGDTPEEAANSEEDPEPTDVAGTLFDALGDGDADAVNVLLHEEARVPDITNDEASEFAGIEVANLEQVEEHDGEAAVAVELADVDDEVGPEFGAYHVELRKVDEHWYVWDVGPDEEVVTTPETRFEMERDGDDIVVVHTAGDRVPAAELYIRGEGLEMTGAWQDLDGDTTGPDPPTVDAGDRIRVKVEDEFDLQVVWKGAYGAMTLAAMSGATDHEQVVDGPQEVHEYLADTENFDGTIADHTDEECVAVEVREGEDAPFVFDPPAIRVTAGTTVEWEVLGGGAHTVTAEDDRFDNGAFDAEADPFVYTVEEPGAVLYRCLPHEALHHRGAVVVEDQDQAKR